MKDNKSMKMIVKSPPPLAAMAAIAELLTSVAVCEYKEECSISSKNVVGTFSNLEWPSSSLLEESTISKFAGVQDLSSFNSPLNHHPVPELCAIATRTRMGLQKKINIASSRFYILVLHNSSGGSSGSAQ
ncbi:Uncharacterized protein Adt_25375 [Abeliophyllum distichum]|uniref:Uncharacterized protein n=1 Tax=Abeliophyllum distichum TaxID=126358 RepID=A0ABD1SGF8_9LAMI